MKLSNLSVLCLFSLIALSSGNINKVIGTEGVTQTSPIILKIETSKGKEFGETLLGGIVVIERKAETEHYFDPNDAISDGVMVLTVNPSIGPIGSSTPSSSESSESHIWWDWSGSFSIPDGPDGDWVGIDCLEWSGIPTGSAVTRVTVHHEITHTYIGDLEVKVYNSSHTWMVRDNEGGSADNIDETRTEYNLFDGDNPQQKWYYRVRDTTRYAAGTLNVMQLHVYYEVIAKPNLMPHKPTNWSDPIVVSNRAGTHTDDSPLYPTDTLYVDWAVINNGNATIGSTFYINLYVDSILMQTWDIPPPVGPATWCDVSDINIGSLSTGQHQIKIVIDYYNDIDESNENDNEYTKSIYVEALPEADLTPYKPSHWNDKIPVGITQLGEGKTHSYDGPYYDDQVLYFNWGSYNQGSATASNYTVHFEVEVTAGGESWGWSWHGLTTTAGDWMRLANDEHVGPLSAGPHKFKVWVDDSNVVSESDESNNYYERTIWVTTRVSKPTVSIVASDDAGEPADNGSFRVSRTGSTTGSLRVYYDTSGSTATGGSDYVALPGYVDILDGQASALISVVVIDDSLVEGPETVKVTLSSNAAYDIDPIKSYAIVPIADDDPVVVKPVVSIVASDDAGEPANNGEFRVSRTGNTTGSLRVYYDTSGSTATGGNDYEALSGYVDILSGKDSALIPVDMIDDSLVEDPETVKVTLSSNAAYDIDPSKSDATVTIADNDVAEPKVELVGLEVIQTIQDWRNSVPLIEHKTTYVRAHIRSKGSEPVEVTARLRCFRGGSELQPHKQKTFMAQTARIADRGVWEHSLNFQLSNSWLTGSIELRLAGVGSSIDFREPGESGGNANDGIVRVNFTAAGVPQVVLKEIYGTGITRFNSDELKALGMRLIAIYPIAALDLTIGDALFERYGYPDVTNAMLNLQLYALADCLMTGQCNRLFYGVFNSFVGGQSYIGSRAAAGPYQLDTLAHELGHGLGRPEAVNIGIPCSWGAKCGPCEESMSLIFFPDTEDFPWIYRMDQGEWRATIGPIAEPDRLIYGLDTSFGGTNIQSPFWNFELMSYCGVTTERKTDRWISDHTYKKILDEINTRFGKSARAQSNGLGTGAMKDYLLIWGSIDFETDTAEFSPITLVSNPVVIPSIPEPGNYTLNLLDRTNSVISEISFKPSVSGDGRFGSFIIPVPTDPNIKLAVVVHDGNSIGSVSASGHPPSVQILSPNGGEVFGEDKVVVEWTATDQDGDKLVYFIDYSSDAGNMYQPLAVNWPETNLEINRESLKGTKNGMIRVMASDGFNIASDTSDGVFTVANNIPQVFIVSPKEQDFFTGDQLIFFEATAFDPEDGQLSGNSIQWGSSIDGLLGAGNILERKASELSEGQHVIIVGATDSNGLTGGASVNLRISREKPTPLPVDDLVKVFVDEVGYDHKTSLLSVNVTVTNISKTPIASPLWVVVESISDPCVTVASYEGITLDNKKYIDMSSRLGDGQLIPGESVSKKIYFNNPEGVRFTFKPSVRGVILSQGEGSKGGMADLARLSGHWLGDEPALDVSPAGGDGIINLRDFAVLAERWLEEKR